MGNREGFQGSLHRQTVYRKRRSPCMQCSRKQMSHNMVWVPKIPLWEKEFVYKIGLFTWENFLEAKKLTGYSPKILEWNDSAAEEAFHRAKNRFYAMINGFTNPDDSDISNPDLYIDEIHWDDNDDDDDEVNSEPLNGSRLGIDGEDEDEEDKNHEYVPDYYHIRIEDIKPTGWDVDIEEISRGKVLTGLIVGC